MLEKRGSLFHAIVIVGASLGASCAGDDERLPPVDAPRADALVADASTVDAAPADAVPTDAVPIDGDAMVIIL